MIPLFALFADKHSLWGIYLVTDKLTRIDDLVHFTLREWSRLSYNVTEAEVERAKAQLKASILLSLDGTTAVAEDIGRQRGCLQLCPDCRTAFRAGSPRSACTRHRSTSRGRVTPAD